MFRKVQLKFFGIITSILIAVFIALLSSVNIIMDAMMEHQTHGVLERVASGVEYDTEKASFTYRNPNFPKNDRDGYKPSVKPPDDPIPPQSSTKPSDAGTTAPETTKVPETSANTAAPASQTTETVTTTAPRTDMPPMSTDDFGTRPPREEFTGTGQFPPETFPPRETMPWEDWQPPSRPDKNDWGSGWGEGDRNDGRWHPERFDDNISQTADDGMHPVLDGFTVLDGNEIANEPPMPPDMEFGEPHREPVPKSLDSIDFFVLMADTEGKLLDSLNNEDMSETDAQWYINEILGHKKTSGMADNYSYCIARKSNGTLVVLTDRTADMNMMNRLKRTTFWVGMMSIILLSVASYFLSGLIVRPLKETFEKQKQFISDASHELKTPLTVISANADVLAGEIGDNKWLNYIQDQADRMNVLVNDLLSLTRLENKTSDFIRTDFDLSHAITNTALPFECNAFELGKNFVVNIEDNITVNGSEQHIKQMAGIFIDNALKYSKDGGTVRVSLTKEDGKAVFSVYNTGSGVKESEKDRLFERFYRSDESRNRTTGGYGLGLAIAKSIIDKHKFKVQVDNEEGKSICFTVYMN